LKLQVINSPFNEEQTENLNRLLPTLTETQKIWLSGFLAAASSQSSGLAVLPHPSEQAQIKDSVSPSREITILFGSETGNCQALAESIQQKLTARGFKVVLSAMDVYKTKNLKSVQDLLIVTATHGEGDPPDNAISFHEFLHGRKAPKLENVRFSVLALGDVSYEFFCQTGKDFDQRLEELGGERIYPRVECDVDFDEAAEAWIEGVLNVLGKAEAANTLNGQNGMLQTVAATGVSAYSRTNPFKAEVLENINLNGHGSLKETRHLELSLVGSSLEFEPGDSLGIFPENDPVLVEKILAETQWNPEEPAVVSKQGEVLPLREALLTHFEITVLTKPLLEKLAPFSSSGEFISLLEPGHETELRAYIDGRDLLDLLKDFGPWEVEPSIFVQNLRRIPARLYSIASSYKANPDEVHLTIGTVRYESNGRNRAGVCSSQCAERVTPGDHLQVYVHRNPNFKLPADPEAPVIMVGPGTGVAPFRSFLEEREEEGSTGKTWLFFGDQHFSSDFLYQVDWQRWLKEGILTRMDVAFSRDEAEKVYVQHRMLEKSMDLYQWLQDGASLYICGDEKNMAKDVHNTLVVILQKEGQMSQEEAEAYLSDLKKEKRYQRDVY
jgi:sulfite reductase (NADPH) flavoprotein alpha-component